MKLTRTLIIGGAAMIGLSQCTFIVFPHHLALKFSSVSGVGELKYSPGIHFKVPFYEKSIMFDLKQKSYEASITTTTRDHQNIKLVLKIAHRVKPEEIDNIWMKLGPNYETSVLPLIVSESVNSVASQHDSLDGSALMQIQKEIKDSALMYNIIIEDVSQVQF